MKKLRCPQQKNYNIGDIVLVKYTVYFSSIAENVFNKEKEDSKDGIREMYKNVANRYAYYVGYTFKSTGRIKSHKSYDTFATYEEYTEFIPDLVFGLARIRFSTRGKEYNALFSDIIPYCSIKDENYGTVSLH